MKLKILLLLCLAASLVSCNKDEISEKQADTFIKFLADGDLFITASDIKQAPDGGYVILGTATYDADGTTDIYLAKTDKFGQAEDWSPAMIGGEFDENAAQLEILDDGYLLFGNTDDSGDGLFDMYLVKTNTQGNVSWEKSFGDDLNNHGSDIQVLDNGGFVLAGYYTRRYIDPVSEEEKTTIDPYILETDANGVQVGEDFTFGFDEFDEIPVAIRSTTNGYLVLGYKVDIASGESNLWIQLLPTLTYPAPISSVPMVDGRDDYGVDLAVTDDDRVFFLANRVQAGGDLNAIYGEVDVTGLKVISTFEIDPIADADMVVNDMIWSPDNSLVITGGKRIAGSSDMMFLKLDLSGNEEERHFFGESGSQTGNSLCYTADDQGYIIVGTNSFEQVLSMIALVKTTVDGTLTQ